MISNSLLLIPNRHDAIHTDLSQNLFARTTLLKSCSNVLALASRVRMSQERPGTNFMMASEIDAAGPYSEASLIVFSNKTLTSKFKIIPSFNSNTGIPLTDPLDTYRIVLALLIRSLALFVLATPNTPSKSCSFCE